MPLSGSPREDYISPLSEFPRYLGKSHKTCFWASRRGLLNGNFPTPSALSIPYLHNVFAVGLSPSKGLRQRVQEVGRHQGVLAHTVAGDVASSSVQVDRGETSFENPG